MKLPFFCQEGPIFTSLSPNVEQDDLELTKKFLLQPKIWKKEIFVRQLEKEIEKFLGMKYVFAFNSGRSAFLAILKSLDLPEQSEVLLQAFTCNAAVNPIIWSNLKPVYVDCNEKTLNLDLEDLKRKITSKSKVLMVQHTFGLPADLEEILEICQKNNLILIEDCAHSLGAEYKGKRVGTFGKASFFSFGRDKIISSVYGGVAVTQDEFLAKKLKAFQENLPLGSLFWIFQQLIHPLLVKYLVIPLYQLGLGKIALNFLQKINLLSKGVHNLEKQGKKPKYFPQKMPGVLALLALNQLKKLERFNRHRREIAEFYKNQLEGDQFILPFAKIDKDRLPSFMRYPILVNGDTDKILKEARKIKIYLDDGWRKSPIVPPDTNIDKMEYKRNSFPQAEKIAQSIINLPTHININLKNAQKIINFLKNLSFKT